MSWGFYGRDQELAQLRDILGRQRWFFARITGRRRIGKTTLVQQAIQAAPDRLVFYVQVPDSAPAGVLSAVHDAMDTFGLPADGFPRPDSLLGFARTVGQLAAAGHLVALDEFQYFSRKHLSEFTSHLQAVVDDLSARADEVPGGLMVLGSLHAELVALLDDRDAPLYNRATDQLEVPHLDIASILRILDAHADRDPERLLFLWNLFEGVPKFYRDAYPGLLWIFTGTPEFFDTRHGVAGLAPLHDRIRFLKQGRFASLRQAQLELVPFDAHRLKAVALRLREIFPTTDQVRLDQNLSVAFIDRLVAEVTAGFKGDVGVVPRQFLREFVTQMDLVEEHPEYDPMIEYGFAPAVLTAEEEHVLTGAPLVATDVDDDLPVPQEDVW